MSSELTHNPIGHKVVFMSKGRIGQKEQFTDPRGGHIRLYWEILDSNAWRCLTPSDQRAYLALLRQKRSTNNGDLSLPLSFASPAGIKSSATLAKSLRSLVAVGLISVTRKGGCTKGGEKLVTLYRLTDTETFESPMKYINATKATNDWKAVKTLGMGRELIRKAKDSAAITQLQKLARTASKIKVVTPITTSKSEGTTPSPASIFKASDEVKKTKKPNGDNGLGKPDTNSASKDRASNSEVLSTVAIQRPQFVRVDRCKTATTGNGASL
jgi:predicted transcriptional regulator